MKTKKFNTHSGDQSQEQIIERPLISADEVMKLPKKTCLVAIDGKSGFKVSKDFYFKDEKFKKLAKFEVDADTDKYLPEQVPIMPVIPDMIDKSDAEVNDLRKAVLIDRAIEVEQQKEDTEKAEGELGKSTSVKNDKQHGQAKW